MNVKVWKTDSLVSKNVVKNVSKNGNINISRTFTKSQIVPGLMKSIYKCVRTSIVSLQWWMYIFRIIQSLMDWLTHSLTHLFSCTHSHTISSKGTRNFFWLYVDLYIGHYLILTWWDCFSFCSSFQVGYMPKRADEFVSAVMHLYHNRDDIVQKFILLIHLAYLGILPEQELAQIFSLDYLEYLDKFIESMYVVKSVNTTTFLLWWSLLLRWTIVLLNTFLCIYFNWGCVGCPYSFSLSVCLSVLLAIRYIMRKIMSNIMRLFCYPLWGYVLWYSTVDYFICLSSYIVGLFIMGFNLTVRGYSFICKLSDCPPVCIYRRERKLQTNHCRLFLQIWEIASIVILFILKFMKL